MFTDIIGTWPTHEKMILVSCDEVYLNRYFPRFYKTFTEHWALPIHVHVIDPSKESLDRLKELEISHTYCETKDYNWNKQVKKFKKHNTVNGHTDADVQQWLYECYCQCQRFILLSNFMNIKQSVVVSDVDAYAQHTPTREQRKNLFSKTGFARYKGKLMATFCHFHSRDLQVIRKIAKEMLDRMFEIGLDQTALKEVFNRNKVTTTNLRNGEWVRFWDIKTTSDEQAHARSLIYHQKGLRGKNKPVGITWTDIK